jgi:hypothetical protein
VNHDVGPTRESDGSPYRSIGYHPTPFEGRAGVYGLGPRRVPFGGRARENLGNAVEDPADGIAKDDQDGDEPDRDERQNQGVLGEPLTGVVVPELREQ